MNVGEDWRKMCYHRNEVAANKHTSELTNVFSVFFNTKHYEALCEVQGVRCLGYLLDRVQL